MACDMGKVIAHPGSVYLMTCRVWSLHHMTARSNQDEKMDVGFDTSSLLIKIRTSFEFII